MNVLTLFKNRAPRAGGVGFSILLTLGLLMAPATEASEFGPGKMWVLFDGEVTDRKVASVKQVGVEVMRRSHYLGAVSVRATPRQVKALESLEGVKGVQPVAVGFRKPAPIPEDDWPWSPKEIAQANPGFPGPAPSAVRDTADIDYGFAGLQHTQINTPPLHQEGYTGKGVRVAIIDTGFYLEHDAFAHLNVVAEWDFINGDSVTTDQGHDHEGQMWHGTASLGIIGSHWPGRVMGTAWEAEFILAKTERLLDEIQQEEDDFIAALEWADSLGVDVVSSSLGYYFWYNYSDLDGDTPLISRAVDIAVSRGIVVVTSAGNTGGFPWPTLNPPADADSVITVGATDSSGVVLPSSSRGPTFDGRIKPDVAAIGKIVGSIGWQGPQTLQAAAGTSASSPLVAGACALLLQKHPEWTPMQVREALRSTATQSENPDNDLGWGVIDAYAASLVSFDPPPPASFALRQNAPNPFESSTLIGFDVPEGGDTVELVIFDAAGRLVRTLVSTFKDSGSYLAPWDGTDDRGRSVSGGIYFYRFTSSSFQDTKKLVLLD